MMIENNQKQKEFCDGCCYKQNCNKDLEKCCYLVKQECLLKTAYKYF